GGSCGKCSPGSVCTGPGDCTTSNCPSGTCQILVGSGTGLRGEYFDNWDLTNLKTTRTDPTVNFNWGTATPDPTILANTLYSARWTGQVQAQFSETYTFYTYSDDGVRMWVNGIKVVDNFIDHSPMEDMGPVALVANQKYDIHVEYYQDGGGALMQLSWSSPS